MYNIIYVIIFVLYFTEHQDVRTNRYSLPPKNSIDIGASNAIHNNIAKSNSRYIDYYL